MAEGERSSVLSDLAAAVAQAGGRPAPDAGMLCLGFWLTARLQQSQHSMLTEEACLHLPDPLLPRSVMVVVLTGVLQAFKQAVETVTQPPGQANEAAAVEAR
jgi:hypothetical protein